MHRIDKKRAMTISGSVTRDLSMMSHHPLHGVVMELAQQQLQPAYLRLADPVDETAHRLPAGGFVNWVSARPSWTREVFRNLQSISQTSAGDPLLTTWLSADRFWALLRDEKGDPAIEEMAQLAAPWGRLGLDEVYFDFHVVSSDIHERALAALAEPCV